MPISDVVKSLELDDDLIDDNDDEIDEKPSYHELINNFNNFHDKYEKLISKNCELKKKVLNLTKELEDF